MILTFSIKFAHFEFSFWIHSNCSNCSSYHLHSNFNIVWFNQNVVMLIHYNILKGMTLCTQISTFLLNPINITTFWLVLHCVLKFQHCDWIIRYNKHYNILISLTLCTLFLILKSFFFTQQQFSIKFAHFDWFILFSLKL